MTNESVGAGRVRRTVACLSSVSLAVGVVVVGGDVIHRREMEVTHPVTATATLARRLSDPYDPDDLLVAAKEELNSHVKVGDGQLAAVDGNFQPVPLADAAEDASIVSVTFMPQKNHVWKVFAGPSDASSNPQKRIACSVGKTTSSCHVNRRSGGVVITSVTVAEVVPELGEGYYSLVKDVSSLSEADLPKLRISRDVRELRPDGTQVSAKETIFHPTSLSFSDQFKSPVSDLEQLATDESLVAP